MLGEKWFEAIICSVIIWTILTHQNVLHYPLSYLHKYPHFIRPSHLQHDIASAVPLDLLCITHLRKICETTVTLNPSAPPPSRTSLTQHNNHAQKPL